MFHMTQWSMGCQSLDRVKDIAQLFHQKDKAAAVKLIKANVSTGECDTFDAGEAIDIQSNTTDGYVKASQHGSARFYWVPAVAVGA